METSRFAALRQRSLDKMDNARPGAFQRAPRLETSNHQISFRRVYSDRRGKLTIKKKKWSHATDVRDLLTKSNRSWTRGSFFKPDVEALLLADEEKRKYPRSPYRLFNRWLNIIFQRVYSRSFLRRSNVLIKSSQDVKVSRAIKQSRSRKFEEKERIAEGGWWEEDKQGKKRE